MILTPHFLTETLEFAGALAAHKHARDLYKYSPLGRAIGFSETIDFLRELDKI